MKNRILPFLLAVAALCSLSACAVRETDQLYSLPQASEEYLQLQSLIDAEISAGCEYSAPTSGGFRQSVQLIDLDGDGVNEALAFFTDNDSPKLCVYHRNSDGYGLTLTITGDGTGFGRVDYADLDGDGISEIIISWRTSSDMKLLKAYSVKGWDSTVLLTNSCTDFQIGDLCRDGTVDIAALKFESGAGSVELYSVDATGEVNSSSAKLSASMTVLDRFRVGSIADGTPAVFVEGQYMGEENEQHYLTDVFIGLSGKLKNISMTAESTDSDTARSCSVYCTDIDGNGSLEVPIAEKVFVQPGTTTESYVFDWYSYTADGERTLCASTYHCEADGWYFVLPEQWREGFTVRRETSTLSGERAVVLSKADGEGNVADLLTIYVLSGENRKDRAKLTDRFVLLQGETAIYAAKPPRGELLSDTEKEDYAARFHLIYTEWNTGAM